MPLSRPASRQKRSEKRRKSSCAVIDTNDLGSEVISVLPSQSSLDPNTNVNILPSTIPTSSIFLSQGTIEPASAPTTFEADFSAKLTNKREKRPKTPKLTKEEKRASSLFARASKSKKAKDDIIAPELLKISDTLPVEDPGRSATTLPGSVLDMKITPIGYEPTHMLSRPLRTYSRRYQPTSPQPLLALPGPSPLSTQNLISIPSISTNKLPNLSVDPSPLTFSYQSSDPNATSPCTISISAARPNPPPRRKGTFPNFNSIPLAGSRYNSHNPEIILHRDIGHCCALPSINETESRTTSRIRHSFSTPITPIGRIPKPISDIDDTTFMLRTSEYDERSDSQFITLGASHQTLRRSTAEQDRGSLFVCTEYPATQNNTDMDAHKAHIRRPRPMSTPTAIPLPQPSIFAGADIDPSVISNPTSTLIHQQVNLVKNDRAISLGDHTSIDNLTLTAYGSIRADYQSSQPSSKKVQTPEIHCSQATIMRAVPFLQPKSQTLHVMQEPRVSWDTQDQALVTAALGLTDTNNECGDSKYSSTIRSQRDLPSHDHALDIESAITDVINVESARFGQLASSRIRDILIERTQSIPRGTSPRDVYRLVRSQLNLIDSGLRDNIHLTSTVYDAPSKSRTTSPVILHAVARSESKSTRQIQSQPIENNTVLTTVRDLTPSKNVCEAEDLVLDISNPQPSSFLFDNVIITNANHIAASPQVVCTDLETVVSPVYYCTKMSNKRAEELPITSSENTNLPLDNLREKNNIALSRATPRDSLDKILETPSPERSLPSVSSEVVGSITEKSLTASSLRQSILEQSAERKSLDLSVNMLQKYDFTPRGTKTNINQSNLNTIEDFILGKEMYSGRLHFVQRIIYDSTACSFDSSSQTVSPLPLLAMDYYAANCLLITVATDNMVRIYNVPPLQPNQYDELRTALTDGSCSLSTYNISEPVASYLPQHARAFPNASPTLVRIGPPLLSVVGYDDGYISIFDLQSMSEVAYWRTQAQSAILDLCFYTSNDTRGPQSLSLDSIISTESVKQTLQSSYSHEMDPALPSSLQNINLFICTQYVLSVYSLSQCSEQLIDMHSHVHAGEEICYSTLTQSCEEPREIYVGCVGGTIFRFLEGVPQRRISLTQVDKVTALSIHGDTLTIGCNMGITIVFDIQELQSFYRLKSYKDSPVSGIYCDETKIIVTNVSGVFTIWDRRNHLRCVYSSLVHSSRITDVRVSENRVFTSSFDGYTNCFEYFNNHSQNKKSSEL